MAARAAHGDDVRERGAGREIGGAGRIVNRVL